MPYLQWPRGGKVTQKETEAWDRLDAFLGRHHSKYKMTFSLEYSSIIDWVADITPGRNHPQARKYGEVWRSQAGTRELAINRVIDQAEEWLATHIEPWTEG